MASREGGAADAPSSSFPSRAAGHGRDGSPPPPVRAGLISLVEFLATSPPHLHAHTHAGLSGPERSRSTPPNLGRVPSPPPLEPYRGAGGHGPAAVPHPVMLAPTPPPSQSPAKAKRSSTMGSRSSSFMAPWSGSRARSADAPINPKRISAPLQGSVVHVATGAALHGGGGKPRGASFMGIPELSPAALSSDPAYFPSHLPTRGSGGGAGGSGGGGDGDEQLLPPVGDITTAGSATSATAPRSVHHAAAVSALSSRASSHAGSPPPPPEVLSPPSTPPLPPIPSAPPVPLPLPRFLRRRSSATPSSVGDTHRATSMYSLSSNNQGGGGHGAHSLTISAPLGVVASSNPDVIPLTPSSATFAAASASYSGRHLSRSAPGTPHTHLAALVEGGQHDELHAYYLRQQQQQSRRDADEVADIDLVATPWTPEPDTPGTPWTPTSATSTAAAAAAAAAAKKKRGGKFSLKKLLGGSSSSSSDPPPLSRDQIRAMTISPPTLVATSATHHLGNAPPRTPLSAVPNGSLARRRSQSQPHPPRPSDLIAPAAEDSLEADDDTSDHFALPAGAPPVPSLRPSTSDSLGRVSTTSSSKGGGGMLNTSGASSPTRSRAQSLPSGSKLASSAPTSGPGALTYMPGIGGALHAASSSSRSKSPALSRSRKSSDAATPKFCLDAEHGDGGDGEDDAWLPPDHVTKRFSLTPAIASHAAPVVITAEPPTPSLPAWATTPSSAPSGSLSALMAASLTSTTDLAAALADGPPSAAPPSRGRPESTMSAWSYTGGARTTSSVRSRTRSPSPVGDILLAAAPAPPKGPDADLFRLESLMSATVSTEKKVLRSLRKQSLPDGGDESDNEASLLGLTAISSEIAMNDEAMRRHEELLRRQAKVSQFEALLQQGGTLAKTPTPPPPVPASRSADRFPGATLEGDLAATAALRRQQLAKFPMPRDADGSAGMGESITVTPPPSPPQPAFRDFDEAVLQAAAHGESPHAAATRALKHHPSLASLFAPLAWSPHGSPHASRSGSPAQPDPVTVIEVVREAAKSEDPATPPGQVPGIWSRKGRRQALRALRSLLVAPTSDDARRELVRAARDLLVGSGLHPHPEAVEIVHLPTPSAPVVGGSLGDDAMDLINMYADEVPTEPIAGATSKRGVLGRAFAAGSASEGIAGGAKVDSVVEGDPELCALLEQIDSLVLDLGGAGDESPSMP
ncbi:hypothetical protein H9P43_005658 [Blastocladiella emersonii ATCC 22665]|nr:hypothetical protein H9P43_005658 [Blastocladiella emersonii ATCC 22665]